MPETKEAATSVESRVSEYLAKNLRLDIASRKINESNYTITIDMKFLGQKPFSRVEFTI